MKILFCPGFISCFNRGYSTFCVPEQHDNSFMSDTNHMFSFSRNSFSFLSLVPCILDKIDCMALVCPGQDVVKAKSNIQTHLKKLYWHQERFSKLFIMQCKQKPRWWLKNKINCNNCLSACVTSKTWISSEDSYLVLILCFSNVFL